MDYYIVKIVIIAIAHVYNLLLSFYGHDTQKTICSCRNQGKELKTLGGIINVWISGFHPIGQIFLCNAQKLS